MTVNKKTFFKLYKVIPIFILSVSLFGCQRENYSLVVANPETGNIFINKKPLKNWLTKEPYILDKNNILYFLDLSNKKYDLRVELNTGQVIDTFFVVNTGESYYKIDLITGELRGFEFEF